MSIVSLSVCLRESADPLSNWFDHSSLSCSVNGSLIYSKVEPSSIPPRVPPIRIPLGRLGDSSSGLTSPSSSDGGGGSAPMTPSALTPNRSGLSTPTLPGLKSPTFSSQQQLIHQRGLFKKWKGKRWRKWDHGKTGRAGLPSHHHSHIDHHHRNHSNIRNPPKKKKEKRRKQTSKHKQHHLTQKPAGQLQDKKEFKKIKKEIQKEITKAKETRKKSLLHC